MVTFVLRDTEESESWNNKVISLSQINPDDSELFDVVMDASGSTVDMYATLSIDRGSGDTELPTNLKFYATSDHKSELYKYYSFLEKGGTNKETLTIYNKMTCICTDMFSGAATDPSAHIIINYTTDTETIATNMKNTCTNETAKARIELKKID